MNASPRRPTVVVVGGGYGGVNAAKALDDIAHVVLVEPKEAFQHNVAALRAVVEPTWLPRIFLPYDHLLTNGTIVRGTATQVASDRVLLASGGEISPDYIILATGSSYPFPAKTDQPDTAGSIAHYMTVHTSLAQSSRVMLLGAGAVGLELAGEIAAAWPDKHILIVDLADDILPGPFDQRLRDELNRQLSDLGVERILGSPIVRMPDTPPGQLGTFATQTVSGASIEADIWFRCYGVAPVTDYLVEDLAAARTKDGYIRVTPQMQVIGFDTVYALGDIADIDRNTAAAAGRQAAVVAANIRVQISGTGELETYAPSPPAIILPLGPIGGAGQLPDRDEIISAEFVSRVKGRDMMIDRYAQLLNAVPV